MPTRTAPRAKTRSRETPSIRSIERRGSRRTGRLVVPLLILLSTGGLLAQSPADIDKARAHFGSGESYYGHKMYPDAAREFEVAYRLSRRPALLFNIGKSWDSAGDIVRAVRAYRLYVSLMPTAADAATVTRRIAELAELLATLSLRVPGPGAMVTIDGEAVGTTPIEAPIELAPGEHTLEVVRAGEAPFVRTLTAEPGQRIELEATLEPLLAPAPAMPTPRAAPPPVRPRTKTPVYKTWWLWTTVGLVVAAGAVTTGVVLGTRDSETPMLRLPAVR